MTERKKVLIGYVRLSQDDLKSMSVENQTEALREYDSKMPIFVDDGLSGEYNLTRAESDWATKVRPLFRADPENTQIVVYTFDRIGRKKGKVLSEVEDITDAGGEVHVVRDKVTYDDAEESSQAIDMTFRSLADESYRVEGKKKTQRAIDVLKKHHVPLGKRPTLNRKQIAEIKKLHEYGLGPTSIGKAVRTTMRKKGKEVSVASSPSKIRKVLAGDYESIEEYEARDLIARTALAARIELTPEQIDSRVKEIVDGFKEADDVLTEDA